MRRHVLGIVLRRVACHRQAHARRCRRAPGRAPCRPAACRPAAPAALPAMSHSAISMALTALPHGLKAPRWRILSITRSTLVGSSPDQRVAEEQTCGFRYGLYDSTCAIAADALVGDDAHDRVLADDGALEVDDFHSGASSTTRRLSPPFGRAVLSPRCPSSDAPLAHRRQAGARRHGGCERCVQLCGRRCDRFDEAARGLLGSQ